MTLTLTLSLTYSELKKLDPCPKRLRKVAKLMGGAREWGEKRITAREAAEAGIEFDDLLWVAATIALTDNRVKRRLRLFLTDCAARMLPVFEKQHPDDARPREAIMAARQFVSGEKTSVVRAARAAANRVDWSTAAGAAAGSAATAAAGSARAIDWDSADWTARSALWAILWNADGASDKSAVQAEKQWQLDRLVAWLSDPEPTPIDLPGLPEKRAA